MTGKVSSLNSIHRNSPGFEHDECQTLRLKYIYLNAYYQEFEYLMLKYYWLLFSGNAPATSSPTLIIFILQNKETTC